LLAAAPGRLSQDSPGVLPGRLKELSLKTNNTMLSVVHQGIPYRFRGTGGSGVGPVSECRVGRHVLRKGTRGVAGRGSRQPGMLPGAMAAQGRPRRLQDTLGHQDKARIEARGYQQRLAGILSEGNRVGRLSRRSLSTWADSSTRTSGMIAVKTALRAPMPVPDRSGSSLLPRRHHGFVAYAPQELLKSDLVSDGDWIRLLLLCVSWQSMVYTNSFSSPMVGK
jgi:hypothetical protein